MNNFVREIPLTQARDALIFLKSWVLAKALGIAVLIVRTRYVKIEPLFIGFLDFRINEDCVRSPWLWKAKPVA